MLFKNFTLLVMFFSFFSCQAQVESKSFDLLLKTMLKKSVPSINVSELKKKTKVVLLDVREYKEFEVSHLKNAKWIGFETFDANSLKGLDKDTEIVVYCSIGVRSEKIGEKLMAQGFTQVSNLYGSIFEWVNQGNKVYDMQGKPTNKVHAYNKKWGVWLNKGEKVY